MSEDIDFEELQSRWETYDNLLRRLSDHNINKVLDDLGERLVMCPASTRTDQYGCTPGGLIEHALKVTSTMRTLNSSLEMNLSTASILKVGLLHELGKVGDLSRRYFIEQDSSWHREKLGQFYKYNEDLNKMSVSHRTLWLLQHYGVTLDNDEWLAVQLASGFHFEENRFYVGHEPSLALLLQQAKAVVIHRDKNEEVQ
jgi:hypothetical protein